MDGSSHTLANGQTLPNVGLVDQAGVAWGTPDNPFNTSAVTLAPGAPTAANQTTIIAALGAPDDAAFSGGATATVIAALKGVYAVLVSGFNAMLTALGGTATAANQGTEITTLGQIRDKLIAAPATEATVSATATATGSVTDTAWSGAGNGGVIAVLKAIWAKLAAGIVVTISPANVTTGDSTLVANTASSPFGTAVPSNGWAVYNADQTNDIWATDGASAPTVNGVGCVRLQANGGWYETPPGYKPPNKVQLISIGAAKYAGRAW